MLNAIIADDEPAAAAIITYFLQAEEIPVKIVGTASDGAKAIELINELKPDLAFLDIHMPLRTGFEVMMQARQTKFIIITAHESFQNAQQALRLGAKDILLKPVDKNQLLQSIMHAIGWKFTPNRLVNSLLAYIHKHSQEKVSLEDLSATFHVTVSHMSRTFKRYAGVSIGNYINTIRINNAKEMLLDPDMTIQEIAGRSGYESLNNFYKYFKAETGQTPAMFRKSHQ